MAYKPILVATFDSPLGFTTDAIVTAFTGILSGLDATGTATSVFVQAGVPVEVALSQIASQANIFAVGGGTVACNGLVWSFSGAQLADAASNPVVTIVGSVPIAFNGSTYDRIRTPNVQKTGAFTANGSTALWTPAAGKRFRLMAYSVFITQNAAAASAGILAITMKDGSTSMNLGFQCYIPATAGTTFGSGSSSGWITLGNGILASAVNDVLNVGLSFALTAGSVGVIAVGTEE